MFITKQGFEDVEACPLTPLVIVFVNCVTVWAGGIIARQSTKAAANFYGFILINGLTHAVPALIVGPAYNPGLVTTWFMFFPSVYFALRSLARARKGIAVGIICHIILMGSMKLAAKGGISEWCLCVVQVLNVLPLVTL